MFPTTHWSLIENARDTPAEVTAAIASAYWRPLYILARRRGLPHDRAADAVQTLFARLIERDFVHTLDRTRGRLRGFLRVSLEHVLGHELAYARARKRGGGAAPIAIDDVAEQLVQRTELTPEQAFDRAWTATLLDRAFERLAAEHRSGPFEAVRLYFRADEPAPLAVLAARFSTTVPALKSMLHRARRRFAALVREEVAATLAPGADVDAELRALGV